MSDPEQTPNVGGLQQAYVRAIHEAVLSFKEEGLINAEIFKPKELESQIPGAFVVILRENEQKNALEVLLVQRRDYGGLWNLPGGGVDESETFAAGAIREVEEETGLKTKLLKGTAFVHHAGPINEESEIPAERRYDKYVGALGVIVGGELRLTEESAAIRWFPVKDLPEGLYRKHELMILDYFEPTNFHEMMKEIFFAAQNHSFIPEGISQ